MAIYMDYHCDCKSSNIVINVIRPKKKVIMELYCMNCKSTENLPYKIGVQNG
jgi:hypothetical protein